MYTADGYIPCGGRVPTPLDCNYPPYEAKVRQILKENLVHSVNFTLPSDKGGGDKIYSIYCCRCRDPTRGNKCDQCNYATSQASSLKNHMKTHSPRAETLPGGNKCLIMQPTQASSLRNHIKAHSPCAETLPVVTNKCDHCYFATSQARIFFLKIWKNLIV